MFRYRNGKRGSLCAAAVALVWLSSPRSAADDDAAARERPTAAAPAVHGKAPSAKALDVRSLIAHGRRDGAKWVARAGERRVELTLVPALQEKAREIFQQYRVPYAAMAAIEPSTGRMLGYVGHSLEAPSGGDPVRDPSPPAASVFKLITASALIDAGVSRTARTCSSSASVDRSLSAVFLGFPAFGEPPGNPGTGRPNEHTVEPTH